MRLHKVLAPVLLLAALQAPAWAGARVYNADRTYSVEVPSSWNGWSLTQTQDDIKAKSGETLSAVTAEISRKPATQSPRQVADKAMDQLKAHLEDFRMVSLGKTTVAGKEANWFVFKGDLMGMAKLEGMITVLQAGDHTYALTFLTSPEKFAKERPKFEAVTHSLAIKP